VKGVLDGLGGLLSQWGYQFACRSHIAGDYDRTAGSIRHSPCQPCRSNVQFADPVIKAMQFQAEAIGPECIGQENIGTGVGELTLQGLHDLGAVDIP